MQRLTPAALSLLLLTGAGVAAEPAGASNRDELRSGTPARLPLKVFRDKMKGGWVGQMVGVGWGQPTEFRSPGRIISEEKMPQWTAQMANQHGNDDCYVEMTFLKSLEQHGLDVSIRQAGVDFARSAYPLWHANNAGRDNLRHGIAPPDSGHPKFSKHADDIDYQIEADFAGIISPGLPQSAVDLGEKFGRLMNYGDGVYAGQFIAAMYCQAYLQSDPRAIVEEALKAIPAESQYAEMIRDMLQWSKDNADWQATWQAVENKYHKQAKYSHGLCARPGGEGAGSIDVKLNGAYVLMGLLYGRGDPDQTIVIACRCGQDSDCNPANAAGVLFTAMGLSKAPAKFTEKLDTKARYSNSEYTMEKVYELSEALARKVVAKYGGSIEKDSTGEEFFVLPQAPVKPGKLEQSCDPGSAAGAKFAEREMAQINGGAWRMGELLRTFAPGWAISDCREADGLGLREELAGRKNVLVTCPGTPNRPCRMRAKVDLAEGKPSLRLTVGAAPDASWDLVVNVGDKAVLKKTVAGKNGWQELTVDLSDYAGKKASLDVLCSAAEGSSAQAVAFWAELAVTGAVPPVKK